jgi:hypothetical protein
MGPAEIDVVLRLREPAGIACDVARRSAEMLRAVALLAIAPIG